MDKSRFADAQLVVLPDPGCVVCKPVTVRWYNEPTGFIKYHVEITARVIQGVCPNQMRDEKVEEPETDEADTL